MSTDTSSYYVFAISGLFPELLNGGIGGVIG
jgi:hypothetical protein